MRCIRRDGCSRGQALGIRWKQAEAAATVAIVDENSLSGLRDAAIIRVMSDGLLRVSECVTLDVSDYRI